MAGRRRGGAAVGDHGGRGDWPPIVSLFLRRLVLVRRHAGSGARADPTSVRIARADRYTYLPQIGLYIALVWGAMRLGAAWPARRWVFGVGSALVLAALMACTWRQTGYWQDSKTLWEHALACDPKNATAHYMLGQCLAPKRTSSVRWRNIGRPWKSVPTSGTSIVGSGRRHITTWAIIADRKGDIAGRHRSLPAGVGIGSPIICRPS